MGCELARHWLSDESDAPQAAEHLRGCGACRTYAEGLDALRYHAPSVVPPAPDDLEGSVLTRLGVAPLLPAVTGREDQDPGAPVPLEARGVGRLPSAWRNGLLSVAATAAVLALVAVVATGGAEPPGEGDPEAVLAAAVGHISGVDASSFRFEIQGSHELDLPPIELDARIGLDAEIGVDTEVELPVPPPVPTPPEPAMPSAPPVPPMPTAPGEPSQDGVPGIELPSVELPGIEQPQLMLPDVELPELTLPEITLPELSTPGGTGYPETLEGLTDRLGLEGPEAEAARDRLHVDLELRRLAMRLSTSMHVSETVGVDGVELHYRGAGRSDGTDASAYELQWESVAPVPASGTLEVTTIDGRSWVRSDPEIGWVDLGAQSAFHLGALRAPHDIAELMDDLTAPRAGVSDLGIREVDGQRRRGIAALHDGYRVEAWVGVDDGLPYRIDWRAEAGAAGGPRLSSTTTVTFSDHGVPVDVDPPSDATPLGAVPLTRFPPFAVRIDASAG